MKIGKNETDKIHKIICVFLFVSCHAFERRVQLSVFNRRKQGGNVP